MIKCLEKHIIIFLISALLVNSIGVLTYAKDLPNINVDAVSSIALDCNSKMTLYEKNSDMLVPIASTTKIMTALVAIKYGDLNKKIVISERAVSIRGSKVGYKKGEVISIRELLNGLMLRSGNDASIAIAEGVSGSVEQFINLMNEYSLELGLINTHFEVPHGLDSQYHYSTAYDLAMITVKAKENPIFNEIVQTKDLDSKKYNFTRNYHNINKILWLIPEADGVKTGFTGKAGKCLVTSVNINGNKIIIVVLNCNNRWNETIKIKNYITKHYVYKKFFSKNENIMNVSLPNYKGNINLICNKDITIPTKINSVYDSKIIKPCKDMNGKLNKSSPLGSIEIYEDKKLILKESLRIKIFLVMKLNKRSGIYLNNLD